MAWEGRKHGGSYYTRSKKVNGKVVREYVGGGILGEFAAQMDILKRLQREEEALALKGRVRTDGGPAEPLRGALRSCGGLEQGDALGRRLSPAQKRRMEEEA